MENRTLEVNGRKYNASDAPIVVVCVDGLSPTIWTVRLKAVTCLGWRRCASPGPIESRIAW